MMMMTRSFAESAGWEEGTGLLAEPALDRRRGETEDVDKSGSACTRGPMTGIVWFQGCK